MSAPTQRRQPLRLRAIPTMVTTCAVTSAANPRTTAASTRMSRIGSGDAPLVPAAVLGSGNARCTGERLGWISVSVSRGFGDP
jgi:hypothetical protein